MPDNWWLLCCGMAGPCVMVVILLFFQGTPHADDDVTGAGETVKGERSETK